MGTAGLGLMAVIAAMYYRGEMLSKEVEVTSLKAEKATLLVSIDDAKKANERVNETLDFTLLMHKDQLGKADEYRSELTESENNTRRVLLELDELMRTEHKKALEKPFERGNAARGRIIDIVCRAWGRNNNPQCQSSGSNDNATTDARGGDKSGTNANDPTNSGNNTKGSKVLP